MCVAAIIEGTSPTRRELEEMEEANPHGAGIAWAVGDQIRFLKGLTAEEIDALLDQLPRPVLLHFRWATHGPKVAHLTHPFVLGERAFSAETSGIADAVLIHNGTWSGYEVFIPEGIRPEDTSDTAVAAYAASVYAERILDDVKWATVVGRAAGGGRMDLTIRGDTWREHNGNLYSNLNWQGGWYGRWGRSNYGGSYAIEGANKQVSWFDDYERANRASKIKRPRKKGSRRIVRV